MFKCPCAVGRLTSLTMLCVAADTGRKGEEGAAKGTEPASRQKVSREEEERGQRCAEGISWCIYCTVILCRYVAKSTALFRDGSLYCRYFVSVIVVVLGIVLLLLL